MNADILRFHNDRFNEQDSLYPLIRRDLVDSLWKNNISDEKVVDLYLSGGVEKFGLSPRNISKITSLDQLKQLKKMLKKLPPGYQHIDYLKLLERSFPAASDPLKEQIAKLFLGYSGKNMKNIGEYSNEAKDFTSALRSLSQTIGKTLKKSPKFKDPNTLCSILFEKDFLPVTVAGGVALGFAGLVGTDVLLGVDIIGSTSEWLKQRYDDSFGRDLAADLELMKEEGRGSPYMSMFISALKDDRLENYTWKLEPYKDSDGSSSRYKELVVFKNGEELFKRGSFYGDFNEIHYWLRKKLPHGSGK